MTPRTWRELIKAAVSGVPERMVKIRTSFRVAGIRITVVRPDSRRGPKASPRSVH